MLEENFKIDYNSKEYAFLLQFEGNADDVRRETFHLRYYKDPIVCMEKTGFFGILDALIDLGLTSDEIEDFYIHGHIEPYDDPYEFTKGIIEMVYGMPKTEIKKQYGSFFDDERIAQLSNLNNNTKMLMSFCYDKDDTYVFIPNKDDLCERFSDIYDKVYNHHNFYKQENFQKIDGKLYRAVRFLVRHGYDFPDLESLFNPLIKDIVFKETNGENTFILNKKYVYKMSNNLLSLVYFLKRNNYKILNSKSIFDLNSHNINLIDSNENQIIFNCRYLEQDMTNYAYILDRLSIEKFEVPNIVSLCDKRVKNIELKFIDNSNKEHIFTIKRNILLSTSEKWFQVIRKGLNFGLSFNDSDNLFNSNKKFLKVTNPSGGEQLVPRNQFPILIEMIIQCKENDFSLNLNQLFDTDKVMIEIFDKQGKTALINRNRITHLMNAFYLLDNNDYSFKDYNNLFDEKQHYIVCYNEQNQEKLISRKQIYKMMRLLELPYDKKKDLTGSEKDLLMMLDNYSIRKKLFEWLPYTAKKWIPSSAVINKIPAEQSHEYFYNNNYKRLEILLNDKYKVRNYEEMEGIISIGYILGLFDSKKSTSEKAMNYFIDYFLKKGVTARELHTTYGAIDLQPGYNKQFADFFMQHYAIDSRAFIEQDLGIDMTGELFKRFDEVLESRPEKKIKTRTRNKLLTPNDAMAAIIDAKIDSEMFGEKIDDERYLQLIRLLMKFGASKDEIKWSIELYEQALLIDEQKVSIPDIEDLKTSLMKFRSHLKSDTQAFVSGRKTNCCSRYGGFAEDRLKHVITDIDWRYVTFTSPNRTFFDGLVWYDQEEKVVCIDNVEGQFSITDKTDRKSVAMMADTVIRYADGIYHKMNELNIPCLKVNVGRDPGTESWEIFNYAYQQNLIKKDDNPCNYPTRNGISTDATNQFTITDEKILKLRR